MCLPSNQSRIIIIIIIIVSSLEWCHLTREIGSRILSTIMH